MPVSGEPDDLDLPSLFSRLSDQDASGELTAACLVARAVDSGADLNQIHSAIDELADACSTPSEPWKYLQSLDFRGSSDGSALDGSRLDVVLARRSGLPIALGVLLIHLARAQGLDAWGVNFPGHFLVRVGATLVDPVQMCSVNEADCLKRLAPELHKDAFVRAAPRAVALRMLNNLKYQYAATATWERALDMLDCQLALAPEDAALLFERGEFWLRLGAVDAARAALQRAVEAASGHPELAALAQTQLEAIADRRNTLH